MPQSGWRSGCGTGPADLPAVQREVGRLADGKVAQDYPLATQAVNTEHSIHLQAVALWLLAALLAVVSLLVLGQLLARLSFLEAAEYGTLRALGMSRRMLLAVGIARATAIGAVGAAVGVLARGGRVAAVPGRPGRSRRAASRGARGRCRPRPRRSGRPAGHRGLRRLADLACGECPAPRAAPGPAALGPPGRSSPPWLPPVSGR